MLGEIDPPLRQTNTSSGALGKYSFYGEQILSKKNELDQKLKETTENLESKLIKAAEINNDIDDDEEDKQEDGFIIDVGS